MSLVGHSPWGHRELDMTERLHSHFLSKVKNTYLCPWKIQGIKIVSSIRPDMYTCFSGFLSYLDFSATQLFISMKTMLVERKCHSLSDVWLFVTWAIAYQAPLSMGFSRQEYWSVAVSFSRASSRPRIEPRSPELQVDSLLSEPLGKPKYLLNSIQISCFLYLSLCVASRIFWEPSFSVPKLLY